MTFSWPRYSHPDQMQAMNWDGTLSRGAMPETMAVSCNECLSMGTRWLLTVRPGIELWTTWPSPATRHVVVDWILEVKPTLISLCFWWLLTFHWICGLHSQEFTRGKNPMLHHSRFPVLGDRKILPVICPWCCLSFVFLCYPNYFVLTKWAKLLQ